MNVGKFKREVFLEGILIHAPAEESTEELTPIQDSTPSFDEHFEIKDGIRKLVRVQKETRVEAGKEGKLEFREYAKVTKRIDGGKPTHETIGFLFASLNPYSLQDLPDTPAYDPRLFKEAQDRLLRGGAAYETAPMFYRFVMDHDTTPERVEGTRTNQVYDSMMSRVRAIAQEHTKLIVPRRSIAQQEQLNAATDDTIDDVKLEIKRSLMMQFGELSDSLIEVSRGRLEGKGIPNFSERLEHARGRADMLPYLDVLASMEGDGELEDAYLSLMKCTREKNIGGFVQTWKYIQSKTLPK